MQKGLGYSATKSNKQIAAPAQAMADPKRSDLSQFVRQPPPIGRNALSGGMFVGSSQKRSEKK